MKRLVLAAAAVLLAACSPTRPDPLVITFSHVVAETTPKGQGALKFKELAEARLPGQVVVQIHPAATLFDESQEIEALLRGEVQMIAPSLSNFTRYTDRLQLFDLPFLFDGPAALERFQQSPEGQGLLAAMQEHNLLGLAYWHNGMKQLSADRRLRLPADAGGLTFRIQNSAVLEAQFAALGAETVKLTLQSVHAALASGRVDGQENTWSNILAQRLHEVQAAITETNHGVLDYMVVTDAAWWNGLPEEVRRELTAALAEATLHANALAEQLNAEARAAVAAAGTEILTLTADERAAWRQAMQPVWTRFAPAIGQDLIDAALAAND